MCLTLPYTPAKFQKNPIMFAEILSLKTFLYGEKWSNVPAQSCEARGARLAGAGTLELFPSEGKVFNVRISTNLYGFF